MTDKLMPLVLVGVAAAALFFFKDKIGSIFGSDTTPPPSQDTTLQNDPIVPTTPSTVVTTSVTNVVPKYSSQWFMNNQYYNSGTGLYEPYGTQLPVTVTEQDVSPGIPVGITGPVYVGQLTPLNRFPGDTDVLTQCASGNLQGGSPSSMQYLLYSTDSAAVAWRSRYCS